MKKKLIILNKIIIVSTILFFQTVNSASIQEQLCRFDDYLKDLQEFVHHVHNSVVPDDIALQLIKKMKDINTKDCQKKILIRPAPHQKKYNSDASLKYDFNDPKQKKLIKEFLAKLFHTKSEAQRLKSSGL